MFICMYVHMCVVVPASVWPLLAGWVFAWFCPCLVCTRTSLYIILSCIIWHAFNSGFVHASLCLCCTLYMSLIPGPRCCTLCWSDLWLNLICCDAETWLPYCVIHVWTLCACVHLTLVLFWFTLAFVLVRPWTMLLYNHSFISESQLYI